MIFDETGLIEGHQAVNKLPYEGQALSNHLLDLLNDNSTTKDLETLRLEFVKIFRELPEVATKICIDKEISNRFHINNFGAQHDSKIMENIRKSPTSLLIGIYPGKINPQSIKK